MEEEYSRKVMISIVLLVLLVASFFILKPILMAIIMGFVLAFVLNPFYNWFFRKTKSANLSASIISILLVLIIVISFYFLVPLLIKQSFKIYQASQQIDIMPIFQQFFPSFFSSEQFTSEFATIIHSFITKSTNYFMNSLSDLVLNFPTLSLQLLVVAFTFFFVLRDKDHLIRYIESISPFPKEIEKKFFDSSKVITASVLYGQVVTGIIQGIIAGTGFFIFKAPNALLLTLLAALMGILPILGTPVVWVPVAIYFFIAANNVSAFGVIIFGIISSTVDNLIRPIIVSRRTNMHSGLILIGMVGGFLFFGLLGLIIGPLILAYLLIILELYKSKKTPSIIVPPEESHKK